MGRSRSRNKFSICEEFTLIHCKHCDFKIDTGQLEKVIQYRWFSKICNTRKYYAYSHYKDNHKILLHRFLLNIISDKNVIVDHKNRDTTDNRLENIRLASRLQNNRNCKKRKNCKSKYKGVGLTSSKKWVASIKLPNKNLRLGLFISEIDAARAYNNAAMKYFKDFAVLNKIEE